MVLTSISLINKYSKENYPQKQKYQRAVNNIVDPMDNNQIKELNNQYLENNYETDVLSFNFYDGWKDGKIVEKKGLFPGEENLNELGELYLSIPKIIQQSKENNVTFLKELSTMAVHGTLHLLGYNHEVLNEEKIMFSKTSKILENISLKE